MVRVVPPPSDSSPPDNRGEGIDRLRRRVVCISIALAAVVVCSGVVQFVFDVAMFKAAFHQVRGVGGIDHHVLHRIKHHFISLHFFHFMRFAAFGLLVSMCGCVGAKKKSSARVGCFSCCNAMTACCGLTGVVACLCVAFGATAASPSIENFMETCDPHVCLWSTNTSHIMDCLAAGAWDGYRPLTQGAHPPCHGCPTAHFMICGEELAEKKRRDANKNEYYYYQYYSEDGGHVRDWSFPADDADGIGDHLSRQLRQGLPRDDGKTFRGRPATFVGAAREVHHSRHQRHHEKAFWNAQPMPANPLSDCEPRYKDIEHFHAARKVLPELLPEFVVFLVAKAMFAIPLVVLACCGFCSGKELWTQLRSGSSAYAEPQPIVQPQMNVMYSQQTGQMTQPLMMQPQAPMQPQMHYPSAQQQTIHATQVTQAFTHAPSVPPQQEQHQHQQHVAPQAGAEMVVLG